MKRFYPLVLGLAVFAMAPASFRRPEHKPPKIAVLTEAQRTQLQKLQKVVPEVGSVPLRTSDRDAQMQPSDATGQSVVGSAILPRQMLASSRKGADVLKAANADLHASNPIVAKLPSLLGLLCFLAAAFYGAIRYMDSTIPYKKRKRVAARTNA